MSLTDDDKAWITATTERIVAGTVGTIVERVVDGTVETIVERVVAGTVETIVERVVAGTVETIVERVVETVAGMVERTETKLLTTLEEETRNLVTYEALERMETKLLTAFQQWASPTEQKLRTHREALRALDLQIEEIAGRVERLERAFDRPS